MDPDDAPRPRHGARLRSDLRREGARGSPYLIPLLVAGAVVLCGAVFVALVAAHARRQRSLEAMLERIERLQLPEERSIDVLEPLDPGPDETRYVVDAHAVAAVHPFEPHAHHAGFSKVRSVDDGWVALEYEYLDDEDMDVPYVYCRVTRAESAAAAAALYAETLESVRTDWVMEGAELRSADLLRHGDESYCATVVVGGSEDGVTFCCRDGPTVLHFYCDGATFDADALRTLLGPCLGRLAEWQP